jgi:phosphatidylglycerol:prolipoprotein diacylglycerol transferase
MGGRYVHDIDPIIATVLGVHLWWYGLAYAAGFAATHLFLRSRRAELGMSLREVYSLSLLLATGVLIGGRLVEVAFYEWPHYRDHLARIPAYWLGGMSTHGVLAGGLAGIVLFALASRRPILGVTDALVVPAALLMAFGRLGNFVDGQIVGGVTDVPWAVKFPDAEGYRHPVVLYDGLKNLLIVPVLLVAGRLAAPRGMRTGLFLFLYAALRLVVDLFREYPTTLFGLATGQVLNLALAGVGLVLIIVAWSRSRGASNPAPAPERRAAADAEGEPLCWQPLALGFLLVFALVLPSDWTQDVPARYGKRHPGLEHNALYPKIEPTR